MPGRGAIRVDGKHLPLEEHNGKLRVSDNCTLRAIRAEIGMVFQQFNLFSHMTVLNNVIEGPAHARYGSKDTAVR